MALSTDLISQFAKITKDTTKTKRETTLYGTIVDYDGSRYVRFDGSDLLTPATMTVDAEPGERVSVLLKDHMATVTGNISSPAARTETVSVVVDNVTTIETVLADTVRTEELEAQTARIDTLETTNVTVAERLTANEADIETLEADNVTINERLAANEAAIKDLKVESLDAETLYATFATISNLDATNTKVTNLEGGFGEFQTLTTDNFTAVNATIDELETNKLSATDIEGKYANIDFSNIGKAAMEYFYANSGLIEDVTVGDATITGKLVGVTISGDLIEANTLVADKLVIQGKDGLYYKLNTDGMTTEAEQTDYNSLNGTVIKAKSIAATKISVDDLVAFDATIGGFNITESAIYSGVKETVNNTTRGVYLDKTGQMAIGDASKFIKYHKDTDGTYKLAIAADSVTLTSSNQNIATALAEVSEATKANSDDLTAYMSATDSELTNLQTQIDGSITTWFYEYEPTNNNEPASSWTTTDAKNVHLGDLFYDTITGYCYRWQVKNNNYSWNRITDVDVTKALADAHAAQDTADNKRRVFVSTPTPPYDIGDLWSQGSSGDFMRCQTAKTASQSYAAADWVKASKYTDDTVATAAQNGVNALSVRMSAAETNISQNSEAIALRATKTELTESLGNYYTKEQSDSNLTVKADAITSSVASTYATKTALASTDANVAAAQTTANNAQASFDGLKIGGRNLAGGTSDEWTDITIGKWSGAINHSTGGVNEFTHTISHYGVDDGDWLTFGIDLEAINKQLYMRVDCVAEDGSIKYMQGNHIVVGETGRSVCKFQVSSEYPIIKTYIGTTGEVEENTIERCKCFKIERGNRATDWTPAPEDVEADITALENRVIEAETSISQNSEAIELRATKVEVVTSLGNYYTKEESDSNLTVKANEIVSNVSSTYATKTALDNTDKDLDSLSTRVGAAESSISQHADAIALAATKSEVTDALDGYYTKEESDSKLTIKANEIASNVSNTYATKTALANTDANVVAAQTAANNAQADIDGLELGGRNLAIGTSDEWIDKLVGQWSGAIYHTVGDEHNFSRNMTDYGVTDGDWLTFGIDLEAVNKPVYMRVDQWDEGENSQTNNYGNYIAVGEVGRSVCSVRMQEARPIIKVYIGTDGSVVDTTTERYKCFKVEKGNRATDWTPAPEDIDADISALDTRLATAETSITQNSEAIELRATKTEVTTAKSQAIETANANTATLLESYSTTTEMNSAIEQKANSITSSVSSTYATKSALAATDANVTTAQNAIDNLQIGGRNYLLNTASPIRVPESGVATGNYSYRKFTMSEPFVVGEAYTITGSYVVEEGDINGQIGVRLFSSDMSKELMTGTYAVATPSKDYVEGEDREWGTFSKKIIPTATADNTVLLLYCGAAASTVGNAVTFSNLKLERGNRATDWSPAPEDADADISALDTRVTSTESSITQLSNSIASNVTETTNLGTRMTTVEQTATSLTTRISNNETATANAAKTATNYMSLSSGDGLIIGDRTSSTLKGNVQIKAESSGASIALRDGSTILTKFSAASKTFSGITSAITSSSSSTESNEDETGTSSETISYDYQTITSNQTANIVRFESDSPIYFSQGIRTNGVTINDDSLISNVNITLNGKIFDAEGRGVIVPNSSGGNFTLGYGRYAKATSNSDDWSILYGNQVMLKAKKTVHIYVNGISAFQALNENGNMTLGWHLRTKGAGDLNLYSGDDIRLAPPVGKSVICHRAFLPSENATFALGKAGELGWSNIYIGNAADVYNGLRINVNNTAYNLIGRDSNGRYVIGNNDGVMHYHVKDVNTTTTGTAFKFTSGNDDASNNTISTWLFGASDGTSRYIGSYLTYNRTYSSAANMHVTANGVYGRSTSSSRRYKTDIVDLELDAVRSLYDLPVRKFKYNPDCLATDDERYGVDIPGFIAEEVFEYLPIACDHIRDENGKLIPEMWNSKIIIPALLKLVQDLNDRVKILEGG